MVVPRWFPNEPCTIKALAYIAKYYNRDSHYLFRQQYLYEDITESLRIHLLLEGICLEQTNTLPRTGWHYINAIEKFTKVTDVTFEKLKECLISSTHSYLPKETKEAVQSPKLAMKSEYEFKAIPNYNRDGETAKGHLR